jgi:hypothetical protein
MKSPIATTIALIAGLALSLPAAAAAPATEEAKIRALQAQFAVAFNAKDADAIMKVYVPNESLLVFDVVPPRQYVGADAYRRDWQTSSPMSKDRSNSRSATLASQPMEGLGTATAFSGLAVPTRRVSRSI